MEHTERLTEILNGTRDLAHSNRLEFVTPETLLLFLCRESKEFRAVCQEFAEKTDEDIAWQLNDHLGPVVPGNVEDWDLETSYQMTLALTFAEAEARNADRDRVDITHVLHSIWELNDSWAGYVLRTNFDNNELEFMGSVYQHFNFDQDDIEPLFEFMTDEDTSRSPKNGRNEPKGLITCVNDLIGTHNPLIGREQELERTIQVLCRKDKNNPLHIGEPGVGKTALIYGLAKMIEDGRVPERLKGAKIYQIDMGSLVAGTHYRGDFEERINKIMQSLEKEKNAIVYIDEIHNLVGAGAIEGGSLDGSNILKPYLEAGNIRFIGATTYKEYNRYFQKSQGMVRRFQTIDIPEPSQEEAVKILEGLKSGYEAFHHIKYADGMMRYAVEMSVRHITDRFLPDKAIDLIDEAGAYRETHTTPDSDEQIVDRQLINDTLKRICRLTDDMLETPESDNGELAGLRDKIKSRLFGQDQAVEQVVEAVEMAKAGLNEADKPLASLLFVGPTGVGKTELCRVLAQTLGIELLRFDMSEYAEKSAVAKLIGSPAGYVGYEDGGLLTDAIRKSPNCVLLLDEIEKAHADIYNILLQVMDYARLTDNRGNKADFRNVILIMTSNAGAQFASKASVGFNNTTSRGANMQKAITKVFKPEFINRLTATVVFNDMDLPMAKLVLDKKISNLSELLSKKNITLDLSDAARELLLQKGYSAQYGAREMERAVRSTLNPLLIKEILWGKLKNGGKALIKVDNGDLILSAKTENGL